MKAAALVLLAAVAVALSAPTRESNDNGAGIPSQPSRVRRQAPGLDILSQVSEAFQQHVTEKHERVLDVMDQVGKTLGSVGDAVHQAISDRVNNAAGAGGGDGGGQRSNEVGGGAAGRVGAVLASIADSLRGGQSQAASQAAEASAGTTAQRGTGAAPVGTGGSTNPADVPVGKIFASIGDKLRQVATGQGGDGQRALGELGQQVGQVFSSIGDSIRQVIRERQEDDDDEARLVRAVQREEEEAVRPRHGHGQQHRHHVD